MAPSTLPRKASRAERIVLFIETLREQAIGCSTAMQAYEHLEKLLWEVELENLITAGEMMYIVPLSSFVWLPSFKLYVWKAYHHIVFIHANGAYAVYYKDEKLDNQRADVSKRELEHYQTATPLAMSASRTRYDIWGRRG